jgi:hypothetical protein
MRVISLVLIPLTFLTTNGFASRSYTTGPGPDSTYFGNAVVSYTIEGKKTTIKNILQTEGQNITALHLNVVTLIPKQNLVRVNFTNSLTHEVFDFVVADKGTTIVQHYKPRLTVEIEKKAIYMSQKLMNYYADNCKVEIIVADEKHVTGKFSGTFIADDGTQVTIKAGSFDIPYNER